MSAAMLEVYVLAKAKRGSMLHNIASKLGKIHHIHFELPLPSLESEHAR
jgi:hypothetical protein